METENQPKRKRVLLTHIVFHVQQFRKPDSWSRVIDKSKRNGKPGLVHMNTVRIAGQEISGSVEPPPEVQRQVAVAEKQGYIIDFVIPSGGIPIFAGKDVYEFLAAKERQKWKALFRH